MAISTYKTYLMKGTESGGSVTYTNLLPIASFGDLGGSPALLDISDLSTPTRKSMLGMQDLKEMTFDCIYTKEDYTAVKNLVDAENYFAVYFGDNGEDGKFTFKGYIDCYVNGGGVNEAVKMTVVVAASTGITFA